MQIACERCEKVFDVPSPTPGLKVQCPHCGDVNIIRMASAAPGAVPTAQPARPDRAAEAGYPPAHGPESDVLMVRPAMFGAHPLRFILLLLAILGGIGGGIYFYFSSTIQYAQPIGIACGVLAILAVLAFILWRVHNLGVGLKITTKRTIETKGLLSKATSDVLHVDIKNIQIRQSFGERLCRVGTIALSSSAENEDEITMSDVPNPEKVRTIIDLYRQL